MIKLFSFHCIEQRVAFIFRLNKNILKMNDLKMNLKNKGIENVIEKIRSKYIYL